ncbi:MAG TPA: leucine-rich repeat domain-containing protein [Ruminococcus flavefaciens]|nr:leucine-rich repeat domain-containing protein [Ruminococcus flavefaciens]
MFEKDTAISTPAFDGISDATVINDSSSQGSISDKHKKLVKHVVFESYSDFMDEQIQNDPDLIKKLFISHNEKDFAKKYFSENKEKITKDYKAKYLQKHESDFIRDNLDLMLDYYVGSNSAVFAEKYYNDHMDELSKEMSAYAGSVKKESEGKAVTSIKKYLFQGCENLETVTYKGSKDPDKAFDLPPEITVIGASAFQGCKSIDFGDLVFGSNLKEINDKAFSGCSGITSVYVPENVELVDTYAFSGCSNLKKATFMNTDKTIWGSALHNDSIEELVLAEARSFIICYGNSAGEERTCFDELFWGTLDRAYTPRSLKTVKILGGDTIPKGFFEYRTPAFPGTPERTIETIALPIGLKRIEDSAFAGLDNLSNIICSDESKSFYNLSALLKDVEYIGNNAFNGCKAYDFSNLMMPKKLEYLGNYAFAGCSLLKHMSIPSSDAYSVINADEFKGMNKLQTIVIPKTVTKIDPKSFGGDYSQKTAVYYEGTEEELNNIIDDFVICYVTIDHRH